MAQGSAEDNRGRNTTGQSLLARVVIAIQVRVTLNGVKLFRTEFGDFW